MDQNNALQDRHCLASGSLDNKLITILVDTGSSVSLLDEQLFYSLSLVPPLQPILFSVSGADYKPLTALGKTFLTIAIDEHISSTICCYEKYPFPCGIGNQFSTDTW